MVTKGNKIVTPANNILEGITRKKLLEIHSSYDTIEIRDISIEEIKNAAEVFMTSTTKRLLPVCKIDSIEIGNGKVGPVTSLLLKKFIQMENDWLKSN